MNKTAIKNFAIWARRKLIADITYRAGMLGITESGIAQPLKQSTKDLQFFDIGTKDYSEISGVEIQQRNALISRLHEKEKTSDYKTAFRSVVEEVAYTWFNRLIAVRFMEVNDYLPSHIRVLSSENPSKLEPDIVTNPFDTGIEFSPYESDVVMQLKDENRLDELFKMLFIKQCNVLNSILPELFEQTSDYSELLLTISFTDKDGVTYHLTHDINEDDFNVEKEGQVEIIGWLYQYYNSEPKDEVFARLKKNEKITKERIPAATQLFTPDWIVRYMVENSLGRLWVEGHPNEEIKANWKYYLEEAEQEPEVNAQLVKIRAEYAELNPEDIKIIDPCMGSGHILVYAFDVLMQIYITQGYTKKEAAKSILINNIYGIDIDVRAYQLAYFAVMMKARQYNRNIFDEHIMPNLMAVKSSVKVSPSCLKRLGKLEPLGKRLIDDFVDADEYGSILNISYSEEDLKALEDCLIEIDEMADYGNLLVQMESDECVQAIAPLIRQARIMGQRYDVVVTNPPYMGASGMSAKLNEFVKKYFPDSKSDLFAVFIEKCGLMLKQNGYQAMITQHAWLSLGSYEKLRNKITHKNIVNMAHLGPRAFEDIGGEMVQTTSFIIQNSSIANRNSIFCRLVDYDSAEEKEHRFLKKSNIFIAAVDKFQNIPGAPITAYVVGEALSKIYANGHTINDFGEVKIGMGTGSNDVFLRAWWEVVGTSIDFSMSDVSQLKTLKKRYVPYSKGGDRKRWYGNHEWVVWYDLEGRTKMNTMSGHRENGGYESYFHKGMTWSYSTMAAFSTRIMPTGFVFDVNGSSIFPSDDMYNYVLGFLQSCVGRFIIESTKSAFSIQAGTIRNLPIIGKPTEELNKFIDECISISKDDWDVDETSWDFVSQCLIQKSALISSTFVQWKDKCEKQNSRLVFLEEAINRFYINEYNLRDKLEWGVDSADVTVRQADLQRDIKSLISYAVGCMFGRYSLDSLGLAYAGGEWDVGKYRSFIPDADNCIPITDEEYFQDDIVGRFVEFIRVAYGNDTLEENLAFIAKALGDTGSTPRNTIRKYFLNDFFKDHCKTYSVTGSGKRPIYWLFDSGDQNGFKALVYMHRWNADTVGNLRVEYLHRMQTIYEKEIETCQDIIDNGLNNREIAAATKRKEKLIKQIKECKDYDAKVAHIALSRIDIDLDDGVKVNYRKVQTAADGRFCEILADSKNIMIKEDSDIWQSLISSR